MKLTVTKTNNMWHAELNFKCHASIPITEATNHQEASHLLKFKLWYFIVKEFVNSLTQMDYEKLDS
jgi:hypothetical protein